MYCLTDVSMRGSIPADSDLRVRSLLECRGPAEVGLSSLKEPGSASAYPSPLLFLSNVRR